MKSDEYKNYSLNNLETWVLDAMSSEATPEEIYGTIIKAIRSELEYHEVCATQAKTLLSLFKDQKITFSGDFDEITGEKLNNVSIFPDKHISN